MDDPLLSHRWPAVFVNHRVPDVKATFVSHLDEALRSARICPFLDARTLMLGNPSLNSIDQALQVAVVHVAVISERYAQSKRCLNELVAMIRSGKPVIPVFYNVESVQLRCLEDGPFAEAFENHKAKGRYEEVQEWTKALGALAERAGFRLADYRGDEAKLKREVVNEVERLIPSNEPVEGQHCRVRLQGTSQTCDQALVEMGTGTGVLVLFAIGGVGKSTVAKEIFDHTVAEKQFSSMTFFGIRHPSVSDVQVGPISSRKPRLCDPLRVQDNPQNYSAWFLSGSIPEVTSSALDAKMDEKYASEEIADSVSDSIQRSGEKFPRCPVYARTGRDRCQNNDPNSGCSRGKLAAPDQDSVQFADGEIASSHYLVSLVNEQVKEPLQDSFRSLVSVLKSKEESEQKYRQKLLSLEEQKLTLKNKKLQYKRQRNSASCAQERTAQTRVVRSKRG